MHLLTISYKDINSPRQENQILNWSLGTKHKQKLSVLFLQSTTGSGHFELHLNSQQLTWLSQKLEQHTSYDLDKLVEMEVTEG